MSTKPYILVVDDDPQVLKLFGEILQKGGYAVRLEESSRRIMPKLLTMGLSLLILDLSMPEPDGFELLRSVRANSPAMPVLVVSGKDRALLNAARLLGASATLSKSEVPQKLLRTVGELLGDRSASPDAQDSSPTKGQPDEG